MYNPYTLYIPHKPRTPSHTSITILLCKYINHFPSLYCQGELSREIEVSTFSITQAEPTYMYMYTHMGGSWSTSIARVMNEPIACAECV